MRKHAILLVMIVALCLSSSQVIALTQFNDGQTHNINYGINDEVWVDYELPSMQTTVNWLDGASTGAGHKLQAFEDSRINISGGSIYRLNAWGSSQVDISGAYIGYLLVTYDSSQIYISGGSINSLVAHGNSLIEMVGGWIEDSFGTYDSSRVHVSGGSINGDLYGVGASSQITVSGGLIKGNLDGGKKITVSGGSIEGRLGVSNSSQVTISGGEIGYLHGDSSTHIDMTGGSIKGELLLWDNAVLTIFGSDFAVDGQNVGYGELSSIIGGSYSNEPYRWLTGTLASGEVFHNQFRIGNAAKIVLVPEPEPATLTLLTPNGGEQLNAGITYAITWDTEGTAAIISIEYSINNGADWTAIDTITNTGSYQWEIPEENSQQCLLRISNPTYPTSLDTSDDVFTIFVCTLAYDQNQDCFINLSDFALLASEWLQCGNPFDSNCVP